MATAQTATRIFRSEPAVMEFPRAATDSEHRSIANMVEVLNRYWCGLNYIVITAVYPR